MFNKFFKVSLFLFFNGLSLNSCASELKFKFEGIVPPIYVNNQNLNTTKENFHEYTEKEIINYEKIIIKDCKNLKYTLIKVELKI